MTQFEYGQTNRRYFDEVNLLECWLHPLRGQTTNLGRIEAIHPHLA